mgnify:CR=1 FL=1
MERRGNQGAEGYVAETRKSIPRPPVEYGLHESYYRGRVELLGDLLYRGLEVLQEREVKTAMKISRP